MSNFTTPADFRFIGKRRFKLLAPFEYHVGSYPSAEVIRVPEGFVTDLASVPRVLWWLLPPHGRYAKAAIVHDYMYDHAVGTKAHADRVFLEGMKVLGVGRLRRNVMYWGARLFGRGSY